MHRVELHLFRLCNNVRLSCLYFNLVENSNTEKDLVISIRATMDTVYLKTNFGECLTHCLTEVSEKRPRDPVEYIAQWLYKYIENQKHAAAVSI